MRSAFVTPACAIASEAHLARLEEPVWATSDCLSYEDQVGPVPFSNCSSSFGSFFIGVFSFGYTFQVSFADVCSCSYIFQMFVHGQTSKTIRMLDQLLDGHQDCCMWPSHSGCDHAYRNESARQVQAGKKGHVTWAAHMSLKVSKDRQHIGSVASTAVILWHWLLDLQLWVSSIREISSPFVASPPWHTLPLSRLVAVSSCLKSPRCSVVQRILAVPQVLAWLWCPRTFVRLINVLSSLSGRICCFDYDASLHDFGSDHVCNFQSKMVVLRCSLIDARLNADGFRFATTQRCLFRKTSSQIGQLAKSESNKKWRKKKGKGDKLAWLFRLACTRRSLD